MRALHVSAKSNYKFYILLLINFISPKRKMTVTLKTLLRHLILAFLHTCHQGTRMTYRSMARLQSTREEDKTALQRCQGTSVRRSLPGDAKALRKWWGYQRTRPLTYLNHISCGSHVTCL